MVPTFLLGFLIGCAMSNTPTSIVENMFSKYLKLDSDITSEIDTILDEQNLTDTQKERYRKVLENQYKNLSYQIKEEKIDGDKAIVTTEIEVIDLKKAIADFNYDDTLYTKETYDDEKLTRLENASDKVKYTLEIGLTKDKDGNWVLDALTNEQIKKIQGMF